MFIFLLHYAFDLGGVEQLDAQTLVYYLVP